MLALAALVAGLSATSCASTDLPPDYTELSAARLVQRAQEAADRDNYGLAINYYLALQERYPAETERVLWASYEIAFLRYKMKQYEEAVTLFDELLARYQGDEEEAFPRGPAVLADKIRNKILEEHLSSDRDGSQDESQD